MYDEDLKRSRRNLNHNQGFKATGCKDKNCIGCSVEPPLLSQAVIRSLGDAFCKVETSKLISATLNKKKFIAPPGGKKLLKKKSESNGDDVGAPKATKKKPNKQ